MQICSTDIFCKSSKKKSYGIISCIFLLNLGNKNGQKDIFFYLKQQKGGKKYRYKKGSIFFEKHLLLIKNISKNR